MPLHQPRVLPGGVFGGESGIPSDEQREIVLDSGTLRTLFPEPAVDHDQRTLRTAIASESLAPELDPPAIALEHTAARRRLRPPLTGSGVTQWIYGRGGEVGIETRSVPGAKRQYLDIALSYDGQETEREVRVDQQPTRATDFHWQSDFGTEQEPMLRVGAAYRDLTLRRWSGDEPDHVVETSIQALYRDVRLGGDVPVGWIDTPSGYRTEIAAVRRHEYDDQGEVTATWVDLWRNVASLDTTEQVPRPAGAVPLVRDGGIYGYVLRRAGVEVPVLRDIETQPWPAPPDSDPVRLTAARGQVQVRGPRTFSPQRLDSEGDDPPITLTAFGHEFTGGSWAAIRDAPTRNEQGEVTDWDRVLVLHASADTVTAVRMDGSTESIPREQFEREVLRVGAGEFLGFSPVGTLFHSWPHDWAWCICRTDTRAVTLHEAWRDSQVTKPKPNAAPPPGPDHWYWKARPRKRPRRLPASAPRAPLRLTLADIAAPVLHDEPLKRGEGPLLLPETATVGGRDVRRVVAKRVYYPPAEWDEELDDRTSTAGPLRQTFKLPDPPRPAQGDDPGEDWAAALVLRLKTAKGSITVNGAVIPLGKLGHNADEKRGWHPYVVPVPVTDTYTLTFQGQCSRALLCVRKWPKAAPQSGAI